jgi:hypothetical protein
MLASRIGPAAVLSVAALTGLASAQDVVRGRATLSYQTYDQPDLSNRGLHQIYDLGYDRNVTDPLHLRLTFRGEGNDNSQEISGVSQKNTIWLLQPGGEIGYYQPLLNFRLRYDLFDTKSTTDDFSDRRKVEWGRANLNWSPEGLPALSLQADERTDRDSEAGLDQKELRTLEALSYGWRGLTFTQTAAYQTLTLNGSGAERKVLNLQGQLRYDNARADGRASVSGYVLGGVNRQDEMGGLTSTSLPTQVPISVGSYSRDDTPQDSRDNPPIAEPKLVDGDLAGRAPINLGPTGLLYQNLIADMGRVVALDMLRVYIRDSSGNLVPTAGLVRWDVFTSADGLDWARMATGAQTRFVFALSAYDVTFAKTSARFFKIVSFGTNSLDAFATELQAFFHTEIAVGQVRRTDQRIVSANLNAYAQPLNWLAFRYYGLYNNYNTVQADRPDFNSQDSDHQLSADIAPGRPLNATLRYERRSSSAEGTPEERSEILFGLLQYTGNRNLSSSVEFTRTNTTGLLDTTSDTARAHEYVRLLRTIELSVDGGVSREELKQQDLSSRQVFGNGIAYIQLTRDLRLTLAGTVDNTRFTGTGTALLSNLEVNNSRYYGELFYRPSSQLLLAARLGYVTGTLVSATTKTWRVEWYPFARGTIGLGTIYDEDVETNGTYRRFRRIQVLPRWQVNRYVAFDINYTYLTLLDRGIFLAPATETQTKQLYVNLTWIF